MNKSRLALVVMISTLVFIGVRMGNRSWWVKKILRETEQEIADAGVELEKLESPISPQIEAPVSIDTLEQFIEEAKTIEVDPIYYIRHKDSAEFYLGSKGRYLYSYDLKIVPASMSLFPRYVKKG